MANTPKFPTFLAFLKAYYGAEDLLRDQSRDAFLIIGGDLDGVKLTSEWIYDAMESATTLPWKVDALARQARKIRERDRQIFTGEPGWMIRSRPFEIPLKRVPNTMSPAFNRLYPPEPAKEPERKPEPILGRKQRRYEREE